MPRNKHCNVGFKLKIMDIVFYSGVFCDIMSDNLFETIHTHCKDIEIVVHDTRNAYTCVDISWIFYYKL